MKQRHILHVISSLQIGGAETVLYNLVKGLQDAGYRQSVCYFHEGPYVAKIRSLGIATYQITGAIALYDGIFWWRMCTLLRALRPDLIHASLWAASFVSRFLSKIFRIPVISAVHANLEHHGTLRTVCDRITVSASDRFITVSPQVSESLMHAIPVISAKSVFCITNGVDVESIYKTQQACRTVRSAYGIPQESLVIGSVGRFVPVKRYDLLLNIFGRICAQRSDVRLVLIGTGPLERALRAQADTLSLSSYVTFIVGASALELYPLMDCFVQPSAQEGLSIALLEAMVTKLPCVVTGWHQKHAVITHNYNGLMVEPNNEDQLFDVLDTLLTDASLRARLGYAALQTVQKGYTMRAMVQQYKSHFDTL